MNFKKWFGLVALGAMAVSEARLSHAEGPPATGSESPFVEMFNGKDLTGWNGLEGFWSVKDGAIVGAETKEHPAPQTFLIYKDSFGDFEMHYKYKFATPTGNSGVQFRSKVVDEKDPHRIGGYQADCDGGSGYDGCIYDEAGIAGKRAIMSVRGEKTTWDAENKRANEKMAESKDEMKKYIKAQDWNDVVLIANGNHITYTINGHLMTDLTDNSPKEVNEGLIGLQLHKGFVMEIQFKDLKIKKLSGADKK